jgi:UDP-glucose 4-epimerase
MVYGPGARANFRALVDAVAARRWLPLASIDNRRRLLSLSNLVATVRVALDIPGGAAGVHFAGDADAVSTPQLVRAIAGALGVEPRLARMPVGLLRVAGALTGRSAAVARLTQSLDVDLGSFTAATGWQPQPFRLTPADVGQMRSG